MALFRSWDQGLIPGPLPRVRYCCGSDVGERALLRGRLSMRAQRRGSSPPMSAEIAKEPGHVLTMKVSGTLSQAELAGMQTAATSMIRAGGNWRILVLTENFDGWERGGSWNDFSVMQHDACIERMAIVGETRWQEMTLLFAASGMRPFPIRYFEPAQISNARLWLDAQEKSD